MMALLNHAPYQFGAFPDRRDRARRVRPSAVSRNRWGFGGNLARNLAMSGDKDSSPLHGQGEDTRHIPELGGPAI
jgi:hypothetical protein